VYLTVYYKEYGDAGVRFGEILMPRYIVREVSRVQILCGATFSNSPIAQGVSRRAVRHVR
jgi:hypothetical protein